MSEEELWIILCFHVWLFDSIPDGGLSAKPNNRNVDYINYVGYVSIICNALLNATLMNEIRTQFQKENVEFSPRFEMVGQGLWDALCERYPSAYNIRIMYI